MEYKIEKRIIPGLNQKALTASYMVIAHESGNPNNVGPGSLESEIKYMTNNWRTAFTSHWVGGGGRIVQLAEPGKFQYGAGPKANPYSYAHVELARTNDPATFKKDYGAYVWLLRKLADDAGLPKTLDTGSELGSKGIKSHDWVRKYIGGTTHTDPYAYLASFGVSRTKFKRDIQGGVTVIEPTAPTVKPEKITKESKQTWTKVSGNWTGQTLGNGEYGEPVKQLQEKLATNNPPFYPEKGAKNNGIDAYYGDKTEDAVRRFQSYYGLDVDGLAGKQLYGKLGGKTSSSKSSLKVDGIWGKGTTKALQKSLGTKQDGMISNQPNNAVTQRIIGVTYGSGSSPMVKALQKKVGSSQDGRLGPNTIKKLQQYLGTTQDSKLSKPSAVVKELQRRLNNGTF